MTLPIAARPAPRATRRWRTCAAALPAVAAALAYSGALVGEFVYDDHGAVFGNPRLVAGDWWGMAFGLDHTPFANRPVACISFVVDHALFGMNATAFRSVNLALHVVCAWLVFGCVRRCLLAPNLAGRFDEARALAIATVVATLWACHPLGAEAVAYVTQRTTLLMSGGLLLSLYAALRHAEVPRRRWRVAALLGLGLGMASKEDLVAGPLLYVLFERAFVHPSWRSMRKHAAFFAAVAATWVILAACIVLGPANETVGYDSLVKVSPLEWLYTQAGIIVHYVRLAVWPTSMRSVYDWPIVRDVGAAAAPGITLLVLFAFTAWQWFRRPWLGWLGALFFLLLAPTSSVMPIVTELVAERRMYLPMLAVLVPMVLLGCRLLAGAGAAARRSATLGYIVAAVVGAAAIAVTRTHAATFTSMERFWTDAYTRNELSSGSLLTASILSGYSRVVDGQGRPDEVMALLERAMQCEARIAAVDLNYATSLRLRGRLEEAEVVLRDLQVRCPDFAPGLGALAAVLVDRFEKDPTVGAATAADPRLLEALGLIDRAYGVIPDPRFLNTLGIAMCRLGRLGEAEYVLRRAITQDHGFSEPYKTLGAVLLFADRPADAISVWTQALPLRPTDVGLRMNIVAAALQLGDRKVAADLAAEALRLQPGHAEAQRVLLELQQAGR